MTFKRKTGSTPSRAISDVPLEDRRTAAMYAVNRKTADKDAAAFDAKCAEMRQAALAARRRG